MIRAVIAAFALSTAGCAHQEETAANLANAAQPRRLAPVVACWEEKFQGGQLPSSYIATVDFTIEASGHIRGAKVTRLDTGQGTGNDPEFERCLERGLDASSIPTEADKDGPGFATSRDLDVTGYRIAFTDPFEASRHAATKQQGHVLVGPRADRCLGLYTHDPPRDASSLYEAIGRADDRIKTSSGDLDALARNLQELYDDQVELHDRLTLDLADASLPAVNRSRTKKALDDARAAAKKIGAKIGCAPR